MNEDDTFEELSIGACKKRVQELLNTNALEVTLDERREILELTDKINAFHAQQAILKDTDE